MTNKKSILDIILESDLPQSTKLLVSHASIVQFVAGFIFSFQEKHAVLLTQKHTERIQKTVSKHFKRHVDISVVTE